MKYRLGLDMGATSIGWAVFDIENKTLVDTGVRIFDDGRDDKSKESLCVSRRMARGARRLQKRRVMKKRNLLKALVAFGLFPQDKETQQSLKVIDPYTLRKRGLDEKLELFEIGRLCFHLAQRKGFLSNRKENKEDGGKLKTGYEELLVAMREAGARTYGEYLYDKKQKDNQSVLRLKNVFDKKGKFAGGLFPFRAIYIQEFDMLFQKQQEYYPSILTNERVNELRDIIYFQRPLKEQEEGNCTFEAGEKCIAKAHPLFQEFRLYQHVNALEFSAENESEYRFLSREHFDKLIYILKNPNEYMDTKQTVMSYSTIKKLLGLDKKGFFNFESKANPKDDENKGVLVDTTQYAILNSTYLASFWNNFSLEERGDLINVISRPEKYITFSSKRLTLKKQEDEIIKYLVERFHISQEAGEELLYDIPLEEGFASLSQKAIEKLLPDMRTSTLYSDACENVGYNHWETSEKLDELPYYGVILQQSCLGAKSNPQTDEERYGKINNATVHIALNQVRHLVNDLIRHYGKPFDISVEYARDLSASKKERLKMSDTRDKNQKENERILKELKSKIEDREYNKRDIEKYKIWEKLGTKKGGNKDLERECPFSGDIISVSDLMNGEKFQIEHIIPFSRSFDDSLNNKVIASVDANRYKGNRTPYEAFSDSPAGYNWEDIKHRAKKLPFDQQWRFGKDAMDKFEEKAGPIARSLNDTRYMTKCLYTYLYPIVRSDGKNAVQSVVGELTSLVRKSWGLNQYKNKENEEEYRAYHNHHAIDAIIVSAIERGQIAKVSQQIKEITCSIREKFKNEVVEVKNISDDENAKMTINIAGNSYQIKQKFATVDYQEDLKNRMQKFYQLSIRGRFQDELYKFKDKNVSKEDKKNLRKRINAFIRDRKEAIVNEFIPMPDSLCAPQLLNQVENINISHKPKLKKLDSSYFKMGDFVNIYMTKDALEDMSLPNCLREYIQAKFSNFCERVNISCQIKEIYQSCFMILKPKLDDMKQEDIENWKITFPLSSKYEIKRVSGLLNQVENINISHKPKLKNLKNENRQKTKTIGQLHEDTAYGLASFVSESGLEANFITRKGNEIKNSKTSIVDYIPIFEDKSDRNAYYDAYKKWFILDGKEKTLNVKSKEEKAIRLALEDEENQAILALRATAEKALKWFVGGGNFCACIYEINPQNKINGVPTKDQSEWKSEIISNYNATIRSQRGELPFYWKYKYPNARCVMTLKQNDMVVGHFKKEDILNGTLPKGIQEYAQNKLAKTLESDEITILFRVKKMTGSSIYFTPHDIAKETADQKSWIASASSMQNYNAQKVIVSPIGRMHYVK